MRTNYQPSVPKSTPEGQIPPIEDDEPADPHTDWMPLPRSKAKAGIVARLHGKVHGGVVLLFDQAGLELCGLHAGQRVGVRVSPDGTKLSLTQAASLKIGTDLTTLEKREGFAAKLVIPALRIEGEKDAVKGVWREAGAAVLNLPGKAVL